ncbi:hypothetical protein KH172YL63_14200 [Bacillus sp. KH172YL63]|nr:hypothetical protein KH172YL63_14200 [Bacillus sp. KH172YL63]
MNKTGTVKAGCPSCHVHKHPVRKMAGCFLIKFHINRGPFGDEKLTDDERIIKGRDHRNFG